VTACDKVYQLLAHGRWFSPGTPASSTIKTGRHDITEILLKVALNIKNQSINHQNSDHFKRIQNNLTFIILYNLIEEINEQRRIQCRRKI